jgi:hypothetical protein
VTIFLHLLPAENKGASLRDACAALRAGEADFRAFTVPPESFRVVPGAPFAYWVSEQVRQLFVQHPAFLNKDRWPSIGASTKDDFRYLRATWEVQVGNVSESRLNSSRIKWTPFAKGGSFSKFYLAVHLCINWEADGKELKAECSIEWPRFLLPSRTDLVQAYTRRSKLPSIAEGLHICRQRAGCLCSK